MKVKARTIATGEKNCRCSFVTSPIIMIRKIAVGTISMIKAEVIEY